MNNSEQHVTTKSVALLAQSEPPPLNLSHLKRTRQTKVTIMCTDAPTQTAKSVAHYLSDDAQPLQRNHGVWQSIGWPRPTADEKRARGMHIATICSAETRRTSRAFVFAASIRSLPQHHCNSCADYCQFDYNKERGQ
jgi:hypothetical protein